MARSAETTAEPTTDRGRQRRRAILDAAIDVVAERGTAALTHRAVASRAGVPLAATTYYFKGKAELLIEAFRHLTNARIAVLDEAIDTMPETLTPEVAAAVWANVVATNLSSELPTIIAEYEMHLHASRTPELRVIHKQWEDKAMECFALGMKAMGSQYPEPDAAVVLAFLTGMQLGEIADPTPDLERTLLAPLLRRLLYVLVPRRSESG